MIVLLGPSLRYPLILIAQINRLIVGKFEHRIMDILLNHVCSKISLTTVLSIKKNPYCMKSNPINQFLLSRALVFRS